MTKQEFKYWINGYLTLSDEDFLIDSQLKIIKNHATLVHTVAGYEDDDICNFIFALDKEKTVDLQMSSLRIKEIVANFN